MAIADVGPERFLVEWYGSRAPAGPLSETARRLTDGAASFSTHGTQIRLLMVLSIPADDYTFGVFAAASAETVAQVCVDAGAPAERITAAVGWSDTSDC